MGAVSNLITSIQYELEKGELSFTQIATKFEVPVSWVEEAYQICLDEAWERTKEKLSQPDTLAVLKRMKDR
jgi:hypothetical protein